MFWRQELSNERIASAYKLILGRDVTQDDIAGLSKDQRTSISALHEHLAHSAEFKKRVALRPAAGLLDVVHAQYWTMQDVETRVDDPDLLGKLMDRTISQWRAHGENDPVWSITTSDEFRADVMTPEKLEEFYDGGASTAALVGAFQKRAGQVLRKGVCLELGAGVGRCTEHIARDFDRVIAVEISPGILDVCRKRMEDKGIGNVECRLLTRPSDLEEFAPYDFFFSTAVLQHNAPPIQRLLVEHGVRGLAADGFCLFQTPDRLQDYVFSTRSYLASAVWSHDMHCFPKRDVLATLDENGMRIIDVVPDGFTSEFGSYTYLAQKRPLDAPRAG